MHEICTNFAQNMHFECILRAAGVINYYHSKICSLITYIGSCILVNGT